MIVLDVDDNTKKKIEDLRDVNALYQNQKWALFFSTKVVNFHGHAKKAFMFFFCSAWSQLKLRTKDEH